MQRDIDLQLNHPSIHMTTHKLQNTSPRRVKVYTLDNDKWIDRGTGYCLGQVVQEGPRFIVMNETAETIDNIVNNNSSGDDDKDDSNRLLECCINGNTQFQRQQDTLLVWTGHDGVDYALSFQEVEGCIEMCEFLCSVQKTGLAKNISLIAVVQTNEGEVTEMIAGPIPQLPEPLPDMEVLAATLDSLMINKFKSKFIDKILDDNAKWIAKLLDVFLICEKNKEINKIYIINDIIRTLIYFNEPALFEILIRDSFVDDVVGVLEYDPDFPGMKMEWRKVINEKIKIKYVFQVDDPYVRECIRETVVLKFLKDAVLARLIDDTVFSSLALLIQNKETEVLEWIVANDSCLRNLFNLYETVQVDEKLYDGIRLVNQFVQNAKNFNFCKRESFYTSLVDTGLMKMIEFTINYATTDMKVLITEVIVALIEHDTGLFKNTESKESLLALLINVLLNDSNIGLKSQAFEAIKLLIDPNNTNDNNDNDNDNEIDDKDISNFDESFFKTFYNNNASTLFKPLSSFPDGFNNEKSSNLALENLCELVSFISRFHNPVYSRSFILEQGVLDGASRVVANKGTRLQVRLAAVRCLRSVLQLEDQFYARYLINNDLLTPIVSFYADHHTQDNLITSTCLSVFTLLADPEAGVNVRLVRDALGRKHIDTLSLSPVAFIADTNTIANRDTHRDTHRDTDQHQRVTPQKREQEDVPTSPSSLSSPSSPTASLSPAKKAKLSEKPVCGVENPQ